MNFYISLAVLSLLSSAIAYDCSSSIQTIVSTNEGSRSCVYTDSLGHPTIGIGFNLDRSGAASAIAAVGADYNSVRSGQSCLSDDQITQLFNSDLQDATDGVSNCVGTFGSLPSCVQKVLIDMTFNMGPSSLCSWPNFIAQLNNQDYSSAVANMKSSRWCGQVGSRCTRDAALIANPTAFLAE